MPKAKICRAPNCNKLIPSDKAYCEAHQPPPRIPFANATRSNTSLYNTRKWHGLRKQIIAGTPCCVKCGAKSNLQVHHKIEPRGNETLFYDEDNLSVVCIVCHRIITAREIRQRKLSK